jgi:hypothetical protein
MAASRSRQGRKCRLLQSCDDDSCLSRQTSSTTVGLIVSDLVARPRAHEGLSGLTSPRPAPLRMSQAFETPVVRRALASHLPSINPVPLLPEESSLPLSLSPSLAALAACHRSAWCSQSRSCCRQRARLSPAQISRASRLPCRSPPRSCNGPRRHPRPNITSSWSVTRALIDARPVWLQRRRWRPLVTGGLSPKQLLPPAGQPSRIRFPRSGRCRTGRPCCSSRRRTSGGLATTSRKVDRLRLSFHQTGLPRRARSPEATRAPPPRRPTTSRPPVTSRRRP